MSTPRPVGAGEYSDLLARAGRAFRFEARDFYAIGEESAEYERFLAGAPRTPDQVSWWKQYLDRIAERARHGAVRGRVRVLADPLTDYQRWMLWSDPWYAEAGEDIRYLPRRKAHELGLAGADWWLLDDEQAVILTFDDGGRIIGRTLTDDPRVIGGYRLRRDLAVRYAIPAAQIAAA